MLPRAERASSQESSARYASVLSRLVLCRCVATGGGDAPIHANPVARSSALATLGQCRRGPFEPGMLVAGALDDRGGPRAVPRAL